MQQTLTLVRTIKEKCRGCYTCIRECSARAIRVSGGQAEVITERCIGCGNCVRVCSQNAKEVLDSKPAVSQLLASGARVAALLAPSFPVEFIDIDGEMLVGLLRNLGFTYVVEVAFGADLVSREYRRLMEKNTRQRFIASACPAIVEYLSKYYPHLIEYLVPITSPMGAMARVVHKRYGPDTKLVFIGPCIAKKNEIVKIDPEAAIDAVLTFSELREMIEARALELQHVEPDEFDPPHAARGLIFPVGGGLLQAAGLNKDLILNNIVSSKGAQNFVEMIREFDSGDLHASFLDLLCCDGCIKGPGYTTTESKYARHERVSTYVRDKMAVLDEGQWQRDMDEYDGIDFSVSFAVDDQRMETPSPEIISAILARMGKTKREDELNCGACGYDTCVEHAIAIHKKLAESEMCLPYAIDQYKQTAKELSESYKQLEDAQQALIQSEKLASMGQLAAGIAHEINNPLGVVLLYAHLLFDQSGPGNQAHEDLKMIVEQADRCKTIVGGLLNFARKNKLALKSTDIHELVDKCLKTVKLPDNIRCERQYAPAAVPVDIDPDQITQVFTNLISNAVEAMPDGGKLTVRTEFSNEQVIVHVSDSGIGIKEELRKKIFEPFFTTKQIGKGTGLGLSVAYGIMKMHRGNIWLVSNTDPARGATGSDFSVSIPVRQPEF